MSTLKQALERASRAVRQAPVAPAQKSYEPGSRPRPKKYRIRRGRGAPEVQVRPVDFHRSKIRDFLKPLGIPQLKTYDDNVTKYDVDRAEQNLRQKSSSKPTDIFVNYLNEKVAFQKMVTWLVDLTPAHWKNGNVAGNASAEESDFHAARYPDTPRFHFQEIPALPEPLSVENFQQYVYFLTHSRLMYRNSGSLKSGIVADILLYTHRPDNKEFRAFRSTETYNYLIKFFGYDKYQIPFAKELLLVMMHDGHVPNINTINTLIRICRRHSRRRAVTSTYAAVLKYLQLAKKFDIALNLGTWNRVYDCIGNVLLKEQFVNTMSAEKLPITANLAMQVLSDYATTTASPEDVVRFVESDLRWSGWRQHARVCNRLLHHQVRHVTTCVQVQNTLDHVLPSLRTDVATVKFVVDAIEANPRLAPKDALMAGVFLRFSQDATPPETFGKVLAAICRNAPTYDAKGVSDLVRGLIHDACTAYSLPEDYAEYDDMAAAEMSEKLPEWESAAPNAEILRVPPLHSLPESYRIVKRLSRNTLNIMEAHVIHTNRSGCQIAMPYEKLSPAEISAWEQLKSRARSAEFWKNPAAVLGLVPAETPTPENVVVSYNHANYGSMNYTHSSNLMDVLERGPHEHLMQELHRRKIIHCK